MGCAGQRAKGQRQGPGRGPAPQTSACRDAAGGGMSVATPRAEREGRSGRGRESALADRGRWRRVIGPGGVAGGHGGGRQAESLVSFAARRTSISEIGKVRRVPTLIFFARALNHSAPQDPFRLSRFPAGDAAGRAGPDESLPLDAWRRLRDRGLWPEAEGSDDPTRFARNASAGEWAGGTLARTGINPGVFPDGSRPGSGPRLACCDRPYRPMTTS